MGSFTVGDVVLIPFPYSDFSRFKKRPALIVGLAEFDNLILCQITSQSFTSKQAIRLSGVNFTKGSLDLTSYIRPDKLFTIDKSIVVRKAGTIQDKVLKKVRLKIIELFN